MGKSKIAPELLKLVTREVRDREDPKKVTRQGVKAEDVLDFAQRDGERDGSLLVVVTRDGQKHQVEIPAELQAKLAKANTAGAGGAAGGS